jgi:hypothetical protein
MKFNRKIKTILNEMPHIGFNTKNKMIAYDFKIENFLNRYNDFLNDVKKWMTQNLNDEEDIISFKNEILSNEQIGLSLIERFKNEFGKFNKKAAIDQFIIDLGI